MIKNNDINTLFSLLDKKPEGIYQEVLLDEKIKESKERWPIFELSDVTSQSANKNDASSTLDAKLKLNHLRSESKSLKKKEGSTDLQNLFFKLENKEEKSTSIKKSIFDKLVKK